MVNFKIVKKSEICYDVIDNIKNIIEFKGALISSCDKPDFIIVIGGDGTILTAERDYPGIPKITFRKSENGSKCIYPLDDFEKIIDCVLSKKFYIIEEPKLEVLPYNILALNEVQLHNRLPTSAVRFSVKVDDDMFHENIIGDGIIIATPFGSSGYFTSAGGYELENYIGFIYNNPYNKVKDVYTIKLNSKISVEIHRGNGLLVRDNDTNFINMYEDYKFDVQLSKEYAKFVKIKEE